MIRNLLPLLVLLFGLLGFSAWADAWQVLDGIQSIQSGSSIDGNAEVEWNVRGVIDNGVFRPSAQPQWKDKLGTAAEQQQYLYVLSLQQQAPRMEIRRSLNLNHYWGQNKTDYARAVEVFRLHTTVSGKVFHFDWTLELPTTTTTPPPPPLSSSNSDAEVRVLFQPRQQAWTPQLEYKRADPTRSPAGGAAMGADPSAKEQSFFQKYWVHFFVGIMVFSMLGGREPPQQGGSGARGGARS